MRKLLLSLLALVLIILAGCEFEVKEEKPDPLMAYYKEISAGYPLSVMNSVTQFGTNGDLGFRTAGSSAELALAGFLHDEMVEIGLKNVVMDAILVDAWEFTEAKLTFADGRGVEHEIIMASYPTQFECESEAFELIYAGRGTKEDYADMDAAGKLVIIDVDQALDWQVHWPAYQAKLKGAAAVIAVNTDGYGMYDDFTLYVGSYRGPKDAPVFTVSRREGEALKKLIGNSEEGSLSVTLTADSRIMPGEKAYALIGEIPGAAGDVIYMTAHYDGFFYSFDDNASGVGAVLGIAKGLIDSGYVPEKTMRFVLHPAKEWGLSDSRYPWSFGSYQTMKKHPEWAENAFALINIDGGVTSLRAGGINIRTSFEISEIAGMIGYNVEGSPFDNIEFISKASAYADDFPYAQKGIPVISSGFSGADEEYREVNHTNMDAGDYFLNEDAIHYALKLYGTYLLEFDRLLVKPADYYPFFTSMSGYVKPLKDKLNADAFESAIYNAADASRDLTALIEKGKISAADADFLNNQLYRISKSIQEKLLTLSFEDEVIFAHERYLKNVGMIEAAVGELRNGDGKKAVLDYLVEVDMNKYAYYFDKEAYDYFVNQLLGADARNSWGTGYIQNNADLFDIISEIMVKLESDEKAGFRDEMEALDIILIDQRKLLKDTVGQMTKDLVSITRSIANLAE